MGGGGMGPDGGGMGPDSKEGAVPETEKETLTPQKEASNPGANN